MLKKILICWLFFFLSPTLILFSFVVINFYSFGNVLGDAVVKDSRSSIYASFPPEIKTIASSVITENATPVIIENYLRKYNSPLLMYSDLIVSLSEKFGVKPQLIVAIAQQESNLGKKSPSDCYNAWGWGIHKNGTKCYNNWPEAIESVIKGIKNDYCDKGLCEDPCLMMKKYTPGSNGSWCFGVNMFLNDLETGDF